MADEQERLTAALADRYAIQRELGRGGMATVYLATDLRHERNVAVKVLKPELSAILGAERFLAEIKVTAHLQHPNILPLYDSGEADTLLYYVMPYVEGETLRDKLSREKQLSFEEATEIAKAVAAALSYAHSHGVLLISRFGVDLRAGCARARSARLTSAANAASFSVASESLAGYSQQINDIR